MTGQIIVVGAGPGVGAAVARRFAQDGVAVGLIGQEGAALDELGRSLQAEGVRTGWTGADLRDPETVRAAVVRLAEETRRVDVLHFNPSWWRQKDLLELTVEEITDDIAFGVGALLVAVQAARPYLVPGSRITATGSMAADQPQPDAATLGLQKAGVRNLVHSLDAALKPDGIRAVSVTVWGALKHDDPSSPFHPTAVAEAIHAAAHQHESDWRSEVPHPHAG